MIVCSFFCDWKRSQSHEKHESHALVLFRLLHVLSHETETIQIHQILLLSYNIIVTHTTAFRLQDLEYPDT